MKEKKPSMSRMSPFVLLKGLDLTLLPLKCPFHHDFGLFSPSNETETLMKICFIWVDISNDIELIRFNEYL